MTPEPKRRRSARVKSADHYVRAQNLKENLAALNVKLTAEEAEEVRKVAVTADAAKGERYPPGMTTVLYGDSPPLAQ